jgi:hypothetical protein
MKSLPVERKRKLKEEEPQGEPEEKKVKLDEVSFKWGFGIYTVAHFKEKAVELQEDTNTNKEAHQVISEISADEGTKEDAKEVTKVVAGEDEVDWSDPEVIFNNLDAFIRS